MRGGLRARLRAVEERARALDHDGCPSCGGPVPHEGPSVAYEQQPDGSLILLGSGLLERPGGEPRPNFCETCYQPVDEKGRGTAWPAPGRWDPTKRPPIVILGRGSTEPEGAP